MSGFVRAVTTLLTLGMEPKAALRLVVTLGISVGGHVVIAVVLLLLPMFSRLREASDPVEITVVEDVPVAAPEVEEAEPEPPPPEPEPPPPEPEPVAPRPRPQPRPDPPRAAESPPAPAPEAPPEPAPPPPAEAEAIADFSGLTLTNPTGESWASNLGNGEAIEGPIGQPNARVTGRRREGVPGGVPGGTGDGPPGPTVLPAASLSRPPGPPTERLRELLRANYPREAQQLGVEGHADVRVRVHADGRVQPLAIVRETYEGFGEACRRALREGGRWEPPLDRQGRPATTDTLFRCGFSVTGF